ncbi:type II secretion system F family protein [Candidatus Pacearchaeota archaeon]|nr:type II secretion system F family protein [Candidatus Pacearchaeota archaeon]
MIDALRKNVETEIAMLREISNYTRKITQSNESEKKLLISAINSLKEGLKILNSSIPKILREISLNQKLPSQQIQKKSAKTNLENVSFNRVDSKLNVILSKEDKEKFLKEVSISDSLIRKIKKRESEEQEEYGEFKSSRGYLKMSNRLFLDYARRLREKGNFKTLSVTLRRANMDILFDSYIALILFSTLLAAIFSVIVLIFLIFFNAGFTWPFFSVYDGAVLPRILKLIWIPFVLPALIFLFIYYYPSTEKKTVGRRIDQELPFAVIHMSAISGSGIEPSEIFKIIALNKEYPYLRKEIRKILNQINLYGYDLVTALNNTAKTAPSEKLSELFSGFSAAITSGASLQEFLEKRSETLLLNYRLEREQYTKLVETFLDIYISVVIAAPMIFLLLIIMISISGIQIGFSSGQISLISVLGIAVLNILFITFLQIKQPIY